MYLSLFLKSLQYQRWYRGKISQFFQTDFRNCFQFENQKLFLFEKLFIFSNKDEFLDLTRVRELASAFCWSDDR